MKQRFKNINLRPDSLVTIHIANQIINEYEAQGFKLTLRQLYYQFVARGLRENTERSYQTLGKLISDGRLAGLIDWDAIEDRTRNLRGLSHWESPESVINSAYHSFRLDRWENQPNYIEVFVEKDALIGVIEGVCQRNDVNYFACRGYTSQSEMYSAAQRFALRQDQGKEVHILHLGDHDPSGIDMTRDVQDRLNMFLQGMNCDVNRLALNWDQVQAYKPPPNPAKMTDTRFESYRVEYGLESWELDALEPRVISDLIEENILNLRDDILWDETAEREANDKRLLAETSTRWNEVVRFLDKKKQR